MIFYDGRAMRHYLKPCITHRYLLHTSALLSDISMLIAYYAPSTLLLVLWWFQREITCANASIAVNRTFDSAYGDYVTGVKPIYSGNWQGANCPDCLQNVTAQLKESSGGGWHEAHENSTFMPSLTIVFNGGLICPITKCGV